MHDYQPQIHLCLIWNNSFDELKSPALLLNRSGGDLSKVSADVIDGVAVDIVDCVDVVDFSN